jgi:hypothetical protein
METEQPREEANQVEPADAAQFTNELVSEESPAWEEIAAGRFMPRRIKGSCKGRALG